ncbi:hypothetical protein THAR02_01709 [Trichoderma harzianum]|uniref:Major facilitator superfamily (MFS) profile domain-containing protein n=1 Tax=Trichoderma harzianum TaxID=5544 RepID=A0A0F9XN99_TRIHA|nr:hypothetical protein THAR02_01709 [Trichoderma harzianum]
MSRYVPNLYNFWIVIFVALGSAACAYSIAVIGSTTGQPSFYRSLGLAMQGEPGYSRTNHLIGAFNGVNSAGAALGAIQSAWLMERYSRKYTIQLGALIQIIGGALCAGSINVGMFLAGRFIVGWAIGILYTAIPVYQSEMSTPATRGFMVSMHGIMIAIGYLLSSWIGFGVYFITANGSDSSFPWRFPISFQTVPAILLLVGSPRLPFSPRWLVQKGRYEEAKEVLRSLHTLKDSDDHTISNREFDQIRQQTEADLAVKEHTTWYELVRTPGNRKRALIAVFLFWGNQMTGNLVIANYGTIIFASLGMTGYMPLLLLALWIVVSVGGNTICALFLDRFGRRNFMLVGIAGMFVALLGECITQAVSVNDDPNSNIPGKRAAAFFLFLWIAFYSSCQDGTQYVYLAEIYPNYLRGQGTAFGIFNLFIASIVVLVAAPTAFSTIGWRFFIVFIVPTFFYFWIVYFMFPETRLKSLEEIAELFSESVAVHLDDANAEDEKTEGVSMTEDVSVSKDGATTKQETV